MRRWFRIFAGLTFSLTLAVGPARAHYAGHGIPGYPGATPRTLCYVLTDGMGSLWQAWIENAVAGWNQANTGWTFKPCETDEERANPQIVFRFNLGTPKIPGGAQGGPSTGGKKGDYEIIMEPEVNGMTINGKTVSGGVDGKGWRMKDETGEKTLDPVLVLGHELSHALGLDHGPGCDSGNLEDPVCPGNHGSPTGRKPSQSDIDEVKKAIADQQKREADAKRTNETEHASGRQAAEQAHQALPAGSPKQTNAAADRALGAWRSYETLRTQGGAVDTLDQSAETFGNAALDLRTAIDAEAKGDAVSRAAVIARLKARYGASSPIFNAAAPPAEATVQGASGSTAPMVKRSNTGAPIVWPPETNPPPADDANQTGSFKLEHDNHQNQDQTWSRPPLPRSSGPQPQMPPPQSQPSQSQPHC